MSNTEATNILTSALNDLDNASPRLETIIDVANSDGNKQIAENAESVRNSLLTVHAKIQETLALLR